MPVKRKSPVVEKPSSVLQRQAKEIKATAKKRRASLLDEIAWANPSRLFPGGASLVYNPDEIISRHGYRRIDELRRDDQIKAALAFKIHAAIASGWEVKSPEGQSPDWEPTAFVRKALEQLNGTLDRALLQIMTAMPYGFSVTEKLWVERENNLWISGLKTRAPHDMRFEQDEFGTVVALWQVNRPLWLGKFIVWSYDEEFSNVYGRSDLAAAYRPWWSKSNAYKWLAMLLERLGIPPIFALYLTNDYPADSPAKIGEILKRMQAATTAAIPRASKDSLEFWTTKITGEVSHVFVPALDMFNRDIARAILMPGLLGATPDAAEGSYARAEVQFDVFMLVIERIRTELATNVLQEQLVRELVELNFGVMDAYPYFCFKPLTSDVRLDLLTAWGALTGQNVVTSTIEDERHVRAMLEFPEMSKEMEQERKERQKPKPPETPKPPEDPEGDESSQKYSVAVIDYAQIERDLDAAEEAAIEALRSALQASLDDLDRLLRRDFTSTKTRIRWVESLELKRWGAVRSAMVESMRSVVLRGQAAVKREVGAPYLYDSRVTVTPASAIRAMEEKAFWVTGVMKQKLLSDCQAILVQAIKNGETIAETMRKIQEAWLPYLGDDMIIVDEQQIQPHRLETIVRTNLTDAYNTGRLQQMRDKDLDDYVQAVRYSTILDTRTTSLCEGLNGLVFRRDDPDLDRLTPPNHFNCRSLLVPVTITQKIDAKEWATQAQIGHALDLMDPGFGGVAKYGWDESAHPRHPAGGEQGGEFAPKGGGEGLGAAFNGSDGGKKWIKQAQHLYNNDSEFRAAVDSIAYLTQGEYEIFRCMTEYAETGKIDTTRFGDDPWFAKEGVSMQGNPMAKYKNYFEGQDLSKNNSASFLEGARALNKAISTSSPLNESVYRGVRGQQYVENLAALKVGDSFNLKGVASFTTDRQIADKFSAGMASGQGGGGFSPRIPMAVIEIEKGARGINVSSLSPWKQKEVITRGAFRVTGTRVEETEQFHKGSWYKVNRLIVVVRQEKA